MGINGDDEGGCALLHQQRYKMKVYHKTPD